MTRSPQTIRIVDDDPGAGSLRYFSPEERSPHLPLCRANSGERALALLHPKGVDVEGLSPAVIGLDVGMAPRNGRDVRAALKCHPSWRLIPVEMRSTEQP